ncbi:MAG: glycosyltransferase, partial [Thermodesulfobacteriota bacterium]
MKKTSDKQEIEVSVIVPVVERYDNLERLYLAYAEEIAKITGNFEFIFIVDGNMQRAYPEIKKFSNKDPHIRVIKFPRTFGEASALSVGFEKARGEYVFTLSSYFQVEPCEFKKLYNALSKDTCDVAIARRHREGDSIINKVQSALFHFLLRIVTGARFKDISCGFKGLKREVIQDIEIYGDLHRFIPIIADYKGLRVKEFVVAQREEDTRFRIYQIRTYLNRVIDIFTIFFLLRFTYKPLRFFGLVGAVLSLMGVAVNSYLIYLRLFARSIGLTDKPSLFLAALLIVVGIQFFAIGIIGEIIIYTHG